jgi:hypothetical protein
MDIAMRLLLAFLLAASASLAGQRQAPLLVSATVRPAARIAADSAFAVTVGVTLNPNTQALVWAAVDACGTPHNPIVLTASGIHRVSFAPADVAGRNLFCVVSTDGAVRASQYVSVTTTVSE